MIFTTQVTVGTSPVSLIYVPPGVNQLVISNPQSTNTVAVGTSSTVTTSTGGILPGSATVSLAGYSTSTGTQLYAVASASTTIGVLLTTAN